MVLSFLSSLAPLTMDTHPYARIDQYSYFCKCLANFIVHLSRWSNYDNFTLKHKRTLPAYTPLYVRTVELCYKGVRDKEAPATIANPTSPRSPNCIIYTSSS